MPSSTNEVLRVIREIQALKLELDTLRRRTGSAPEVEAKQRTLDQLRWRLAVVARRAATDDVGAAA
jgi:UDP-glucose 4-epimerase